MCYARGACVSNVRLKLSPQERAKALKAKILAKLDEILDDELPRAGTHGIKLTLDIAPLEKQDFEFILAKKI